MARTVLRYVAERGSNRLGDFRRGVDATERSREKLLACGPVNSLDTRGEIRRRGALLGLAEAYGSGFTVCLAVTAHLN
jgi:hypothetical protein